MENIFLLYFRPNLVLKYLYLYYPTTSILTIFHFLNISLFTALNFFTPFSYFTDYENMNNLLMIIYSDEITQQRLKSVEWAPPLPAAKLRSTHYCINSYNPLTLYYSAWEYFWSYIFSRLHFFTLVIFLTLIYDRTYYCAQEK